MKEGYSIRGTSPGTFVCDTSGSVYYETVLNRLELSNHKQSRCHKLPHDAQKVEACLLKMGVRCLPRHAEEVVVDLDAMGHLVHGMQEPPASIFATPFCRAK